MLKSLHLVILSFDKYCSWMVLKLVHQACVPGESLQIVKLSNLGMSVKCCALCMNCSAESQEKHSSLINPKSWVCRVSRCF